MRRGARGARRRARTASRVHPRPDDRAISGPRTCDELARIAQDTRTLNLNIEGNPFENALELVRARAARISSRWCRRSGGSSTSDHGWDLARDCERAAPLIAGK